MKKMKKRQEVSKGRVHEEEDRGQQRAGESVRLGEHVINQEVVAGVKKPKGGILVPFVVGGVERGAVYLSTVAWEGQGGRAACRQSQRRMERPL